MYCFSFSDIFSTELFFYIINIMGERGVNLLNCSKEFVTKIKNSVTRY